MMPAESKRRQRHVTSPLQLKHPMLMMESVLLMLLISASVVFCQDTDANVALHNDATQSGVIWGQIASKAVDGDEDTCAKADTQDHSYHGGGSSAWWQVDLAATYTVISVTIYSNDWFTVNDSSIYVSRLPDISDGGFRYDCGQASPPVLSVQPLIYSDYYKGTNQSLPFTVNCSLPRVGRFVSVKRNQGSTYQTKMTLCEVQVDAHLYYSCDNCAGKCNETHGCSECFPGFLPPSCSSGCSPGYYGTNCAFLCPECRDTGLPCDTMSGLCPFCSDVNGCQGPNGQNSFAPVVNNGSSTTPAQPTSCYQQMSGCLATVAGALMCVLAMKIV